MDSLRVDSRVDLIDYLQSRELNVTLYFFALFISISKLNKQQKRSLMNVHCICLPFFLLLLVLVLTLHFVFAQFNTSMRFNECLVSDFCHWNYAQSCCFLLSIWIEIAHIFLLIFFLQIEFIILLIFSYVRSHLVLKFSITWWQKLIENKKSTQKLKNFIHCSLLLCA